MDAVRDAAVSVRELTVEPGGRIDLAEAWSSPNRARQTSRWAAAPTP